MRFSSKQIHAGVTLDPTTGAILTPIYQSTTYVQESVDRYLEKGFTYSRSGNPTVRALELKLAALEDGADCICFATGIAAIHGVMLAFLNADDHAIISDVACGGRARGKRARGYSRRAYPAVCRTGGRRRPDRGASQSLAKRPGLADSSVFQALPQDRGTSDTARVSKFGVHDFRHILVGVGHRRKSGPYSGRNL